MDQLSSSSYLWNKLNYYVYED